eukprot:TRINITY_DN46379_c0_g1_i1.p1 TRINITY_DN46379_c0_g1~~TRINITY_DN46379_c0_g1_i1.p1  ORF type:complete len:119 (+),score=23.07 TRINITY_DN46379_c0_g1_i1:83-439(+)
MRRRPPRSTLSSSSAASDVYKRQRLESIASSLLQLLSHPDTKVRQLSFSTMVFLQRRCRTSQSEPPSPADRQLLGHCMLAHVQEGLQAGVTDPHLQLQVCQFLSTYCLLYTSPSPRDS